MKNSAQHPLLERVEFHRRRCNWDAALDAIDQAQRAGLRYTTGRTPLPFVRQLVESERSRTVDTQVEALLKKAERAVAGQEINRARSLYAQALQIPHLDRAQQRQIRGASERLETQANRPERLDRILRNGANIEDDHTLKLLETVRRDRPNMARFLRMASVPLWLDEDVLAVMRNHVGDGREAELLERMSQLPFGYAWEEGRYTLSKRARQFFLAEWRQRVDEFRALNARLAKHFADRLQHNPPRNPAQIERLTQAKLYHTFLAEPQAGVRLMREIFQHAEDTYQLAAARQYIAVLQELEGLIPAPFFAYVEYAEAWFHTIKGNHYAAESIYTELCQREGLSLDLTARAQRGLADVRAATGEWGDAFALYRKALSKFQVREDSEDAAETMVALGNAYLEMAQQATDESDPFEPGQPVYNGILALASFLLRLPLLVYLLWTLDFHWPPPNVFRLGQGVDWVIARLYSSAIRWYGRAEAQFAQMDDPAGLARTRESLARLYLALHYPSRAAELLTPLAAGAASGTYQWARLQLHLADVALEQGRLSGVEARLQSALSVFGGLGHQRQVAQTQTRLGYLARRLGKHEDAVRAYTAAFHAWHNVEDAARATDALHAAEQVAAGVALSSPTRTAVEQAQEQLPERVYTMRYVHPWLGAFQRLGIALFFVVLLVALWSGVRTETDIQMGAEVQLQRPVPVAETSDRFRPTVTTSDDVSTNANTIVSSQVDISADISESRFFVNFILVAPLVYLLWYTMIGVVLLHTTQLRSVQRQQTRTIHVTDESISTFRGSEPILQIPWNQVRLLLLSNISLSRNPIEFISSFALADQTEILEVPGESRHYSHLLVMARRRIPAQARVRNSGFSVLHSPMGWLFLGSLLAVGIYVIGIYVQAFFGNLRVLDGRLFGTWYRLADLYSLPFVGASIPLYFWLIVQPARTYLARRESIGLMWSLTGINIILAGLAVGQFIRAQLPFARPDVVLPILLLFSVGYTLAIQLRSPKFRSRASRITIATATSLLLAVFGLWLLSREAEAFHHLVRGNSLIAGVSQFESGAEMEQASYESALAAFQRSSTLRPIPSIRNNHAHVLSQLGRYEEAVTSYDAALRARPRNLIYRKNLALTYTAWSAQLALLDEREAHFLAALREYETIIQQLSQPTPNSPVDAAFLKQARELRAATQFELAVAYLDGDMADEEVKRQFEIAMAMYEGLIEQYGEDAVGYMGRGWSHFFLRHAEGNDLGERKRLEAAIDDFRTALRMDPSHMPAYNGLGWSHFYISTIIPGHCIRGFANPAVKPEYIDQIEAAVDAFTRGVSVEDNGWFYRTRAQLQYILGYCGAPYSREAQLRLTIEDYHRAIRVDPRLDWYIVLGQLYKELGNYLADEGGDARAEYERAAPIFLEALRLDPSFGRARDELRDLYLDKLGRTDEDALDDILNATGQRDSITNLLALAEGELRRGKFGLGHTAVQRVLARYPLHGEAAKLLSRIMFHWARAYDSANRPARYQAALDAAYLAIGNGAGDAETYFLLTQIYHDLGRDEMAQPLLEQTSRMPITNPEVRFGLGYMYLVQNDEEATRVNYQRGSALAGRVTDKATRDHIFATAIADVLTAPTALISNTVIIAKDLAASAVVDSEIPPGEAQAHAIVGMAAMERGEYIQALPLLTQAVILEPFNQEYWNPFRDTLIEGLGKGQVESAEALLTLIMGSTGKGDVETLLEVAELDLARDVFGLAVAALERALILEPENAQLYALLTEAYARWGHFYDVPRRHTQSLETTERAAEVGVVDARIFVWKAHAHLGLGQAAEARAAAERAIELDPENADGHSRLAWATYLLGAYERSVAASNRAIELQPYDSSEYFNRGLAYIALGDAANARESYDAGIKIANASVNAEQRSAWLDEAIDALSAALADPLGLAPELIARLQYEQAVPPQE